MTLLHTLSSQSRFHDIRFHKLDSTAATSSSSSSPPNEAMLVACEDGKVRIFIEKEKKDGEKVMESISELVGHANR
jgi:hypothetical protein